MGISSSTESKSIVEAQASIAQQYSGECSISCSNVMDNTTVNLENAYFSDFNITQSCNINANCMMSSNAGAITDIMAKSGSQADLSGDIPIFKSLVNKSKSDSIVTMKQEILESVQQKCEMKNSNEMRNVTINANNPSFTKISVNQLGNVTGGCTMSNLLNASALASGQADSTARNGKEKKGKNGKIVSSIGIIVLLMVIVVVAFLMLRTVANSPQTQDTIVKLATVAAV